MQLLKNGKCFWHSIPLQSFIYTTIFSVHYIPLTNKRYYKKYKNYCQNLGVLYLVEDQLFEKHNATFITLHAIAKLYIYAGNWAVCIAVITISKVYKIENFLLE